MSAAHVIVKQRDNHMVMVCLHCGAQVAMLSPVDLTSLLGLLDSFRDSHASCKLQTERAICGDCLGSGHTAEEHRNRKLASPEEWLRGGDTGLSSLCIYRHMMGQQQDRYWGAATPRDEYDFGRCYRLLKQFPAWRARIGEMRDHAGWNELTEAWEELEALYSSGRNGDLYRMLVGINERQR